VIYHGATSMKSDLRTDVQANERACSRAKGASPWTNPVCACLRGIGYDGTSAIELLGPEYREWVP
jgi:hypothetical protein